MREKHSFGVLTFDDEDINISEYPTTINASPGKAVELTLGDLHGNALKLLYTLVREGVVEINKEDYKIFADIYNAPTDRITSFQFQKLYEILANIKVHPVKLVRLLGDDTGDRGNNDYLTLLLFASLQQKQIPLEIIFSNHSEVLHRVMDLFQYYKNYISPEQPDPEVLFKILEHGSRHIQPTAESIIGLGILMLDETVNFDEIEKLVWGYYKPCVKLISYTIHNDQDISLYMHAPNGFETIAELAKHYDVKLETATPQLLAKTIDEINQKFNIDLCNGTLERNYMREADTPKGWDKATNKMLQPPYAPHYRLVWNRIQTRDDDYRIVFPDLNYHVSIIHGHTGKGPYGSLPGWQSNPQVSLCDMDTNFGKNPALNERPQSDYCTLHTTSYAPRPQPFPIILPTQENFNPQHLDSELLQMIDNKIQEVKQTREEQALDFDEYDSEETVNKRISPVSIEEFEDFSPNQSEDEAPSVSYKSKRKAEDEIEEENPTPPKKNAF